jgi:hemolysin-activating ACP:hemolysin acyltransferase
LQPNPVGVDSDSSKDAVAKVARLARAKQNQFAESFAQIVAVFMRDRSFRALPIGELEWMILPPLMQGQFALAHAPVPQGNGKGQGKKPTPHLPVALAVWARVSPSIDKSLTEDLDTPIKLQPADWASGDNVWLLVLAGDQRAHPRLLAQLCQTEFKGRQVKMRKRGPDGKIVVERIGASS